MRSVRRRLAAIRHVHHRYAGHHLEQLGCEVDRRANAARSEIDRSGIGFAVSDEFGNRLCRERRTHFHHVRYTRDTGDRGAVAHEVVIQFLIQRRVDRVRCIRQHQRVAVRRSIQSCFGRDVACRTGPVLDNELLPKPLRQPLRDQPRHDVVRATGGVADQDADGA
jgi:hypothetical protein